jgi:hypothetical protein
MDAIFAALNNPYLYSLYENMLGKVQEENRNATLSMLRWVTYAVRPLHGQELIEALQAETGIQIEIDAITKMCGGLLSLDENGLVRLVHATVREYLESRMKFNGKAVSNEANEVLARYCLKSLSSETLLQTYSPKPADKPRTQRKRSIPCALLKTMPKVIGFRITASQTF